MREVHLLFHDKMTAKRHAAYSKHSNKLSGNYYENDGPNSYTDSSVGFESPMETQNNSNNSSNRAVAQDAVAIPIPKRNNQIPPEIEEPENLVDVTEEAWFENERQGSLDQEDFDAIQRQIFGQQKNYLYERMKNSPKPKSSKEQTPITDNQMNTLDEAGTPISSAKKAEQLNTPSYDSNHNFKALKRGFSLDMPFELEMGDEENTQQPQENMTNKTIDPQTSTENRKSEERQERKSSSEQLKARIPFSELGKSLLHNDNDHYKPMQTKKSSQEDGDAAVDVEKSDDENEYLLQLKGAIPIESPERVRQKSAKRTTAAEAAQLFSFQQSPNLVHTPPPRQKHSTDYLIEAGLLLEGTGTTPLKQHSILNNLKKEIMKTPEAEEQEQQEDGTATSLLFFHFLIFLW
jgi:hypothetical protein